ncbi:MAG: hypothetical protein KTR32_07055 [Granulosicoccus sp.]|nr:hypothetical protein [Granulosicoccus sp.]
MFRSVNARVLLLTALAVGLAAFFYQSRIWQNSFSQSFVSLSDKPDGAGVPALNDPALDKSVALSDERMVSPFDPIDPKADTPSEIDKPNLPTKAANAKEISDRLLSVLSRISSYGSTGNHEQWGAVRTDILKLIEKNPAVLEALLEQYPDTSTDIEKSLLKDIFQFSDHDTLENNIVNKVAHERPEHTALWLDLIQSIGVVYADNQKVLLEKLSSLDEPGQIRNAVSALVPDNVLSVSNQLVIERLEPLYDHPDETVRLSVVRKMGEWAGPEHGYLVEQILNNPSVSVQDAGLQSLFTSGLQSERIKSSLLTIMQNVRTDWNLRRSAFFALSEYSLHGAERNAFLQFKHTMNSPPPVLGEG